MKPRLSITRLYHCLINPPLGYSGNKLLILSFLTLKQLPTDAAGVLFMRRETDAAVSMKAV
jgi:hypothetical protein